MPGIAAATLIQKNAGQPSSSATEPEGAATTSLPTAIRLDNKAYWVAEKRGLQMLIINPTSEAVARP